MIELKITSNNPDELRIMASALTQLANLAEDKGYILPVNEEVPAILKEQNPVEPEEVSEVSEVSEDIPEVDADGYPWDERIHSTAHSRNGNGTWKLLRRPKKFGDDDIAWKIEIERVKTILRGESEESQEDPASVFGGVSGDPKENEKHTNADTSTNSEDPAAGMEDNAGTVSMTFPDLMKFVTSNKAVLTMPVINTACDTYGLASLMALQSDDTYIDFIYNDLLKVVEGAS